LPIAYPIHSSAWLDRTLQWASVLLQLTNDPAYLGSRASTAPIFGKAKGHLLAVEV